jgi:hypothetical protein
MKKRECSVAVMRSGTENIAFPQDRIARSVLTENENLEERSLVSIYVMHYKGIIQKCILKYSVVCI